MVKKGAGRARYEPGPAFEENKEEAMLDISPTDSTEFWLIQWPINQMFLIFMVKKFPLSYTTMETWAVWRVPRGNLTNLSALLLSSLMLLSSCRQDQKRELWGRFRAEFAWFIIMNLKNLRNQVSGVLLLAVRNLQVLQGRPCLGSPAHRRIAAAKVQLYHWVNGALSQHPNTSKKERMKAAWTTRMCQASPPKDLRLVVQAATRPQRCQRRQQRNPRRKRRLRSQSSSDASGSIISHHRGEDMLIFPQLSAVRVEFCRKDAFSFFLFLTPDPHCADAECFARPLGGICEMRLREQRPLHGAGLPPFIAVIVCTYPVNGLAPSTSH